MRALHLADVHLDTPFAGRSERLRRRLRSASRAALSAAVDCALAERVHVVLIAGDLFDGERLSLGTELFLLDELARLSEAEIRVVYATGNHDWGRSRRPREVAWPPNVTVVDTPDPRRIPIEARDGQLLGFVTAAGHASARETADLSSAFQPPPGELPEIAVLHSQVVGATGGEETRTVCAVGASTPPRQRLPLLGARPRACATATVRRPGDPLSGELTGPYARRAGGRRGGCWWISRLRMLRRLSSRRSHRFASRRWR